MWCDVARVRAALARLKAMAQHINAQQKRLEEGQRLAALQKRIKKLPPGLSLLDAGRHFIRELSDTYFFLHAVFSRVVTDETQLSMLETGEEMRALLFSDLLLLTSKQNVLRGTVLNRSTLFRLTRLNPFFYLAGHVHLEELHSAEEAGDFGVRLVFERCNRPGHARDTGSMNSLAGLVMPPAAGQAPSTFPR